MHVDGATILDEPLHLHDVVAGCAALEVANDAKERGEHDYADANRSHETENLVESVHACEVAQQVNYTRCISCRLGRYTNDPNYPQPATASRPAKVPGALDCGSRSVPSTTRAA